MYTIKFQSWDDAYPLFKGSKREQHAASTSMVEGKKIWHRPFEVASVAEYNTWQNKFGWGAQYTTCQVVGEDPGEILRKMEEAKDTSNSIYFEYMTFYDQDGEFNKVIIFCANAYIMNREGQTVDTISA